MSDERELKDVRVGLVMTRAEVQRIDEWRRQQPDLPSRSEAIRRLLEIALSA